MDRTCWDQPFLADPRVVEPPGDLEPHLAMIS
jgi:hypothetical protein